MVLKFRAVNKNIFEAIRDGRKKVETRAATEKYRQVKQGEALIMVCGKERIEKMVKRVAVFPGIKDLTIKYKIKDINPDCETMEELEKVYYSFPGYREKIKKHGLIAWELE